MDEIGQEVFKRQTGSAPTFQSIDGVGPKTAEKVKGTIVEGEGRIQAPQDVSDLTDDTLADKAGISKTRARKVIKGAGGNPDREPRSTTGSVEAGNIAEGLDSASQDAARTVEQRRDVFEGVVEVGEDLPDMRERRRGNFGPLEEEDPERVRELGRAAETFQQATRDPIDPTKERQTLGFDPDESREKAAEVSLAASRFLEQEQGLDFDEARSAVESGQPDLDTADSAVSNLVSGGVMGGGTLRGPAAPTDIGRGRDGEFQRPESAPDIEPAPISRNRKSGEFGLDPFDLTSGGVGESLDLFGGDR
jgi:hypothetical protein